MESLVLNYIRSHGDKWQERFAKDYPTIKVKVDPVEQLAIFNYAAGTNFTKGLVQEARGIIIDLARMKVACWPFRKFGKWDDAYADTIDWTTARVQEKVDGSIVKVWWNPNHDAWQFSSNSMIDAAKAFLDSERTVNLDGLFRAAENFGDIPFDALDRDMTYMFELAGPANMVVVRHSVSRIYHIGTRSNIDGTEHEVDIGVQKPTQYNYTSLEECIRCVTDDMNRSQTGKIGHVEQEGFVVVDANWNRVKIKSPIYMTIHGLVTNNQATKRAILTFLWNDVLDVPEICKDFAKLSHLVKYYDFRLTEFRVRASIFINITRQIYRMLNGNRGEVARRISGHRYMALGLMALDNPDKTPEELFKMVGINKIANLIPDYEPENLGYLFEGINPDGTVMPLEKKEPTEPEVIGKRKRKKYREAKEA